MWNDNHHGTKTVLAPFYRRLLALFYDALLVFSLWLVASLLIIIFLTHGKPIPPEHPFYQNYQVMLFAIVFCFFAGFWAYGGQTAGMRAWRIKVVSKLSGCPPSAFRAGLRFLLMIITQACGGSGWLWVFLDPDRQTLYDRLSGTQMIFLKKEEVGR